ncbi:MAG: T9SS type A sorting domain-containing protein [Bacteroidetes bacterium]|nr:T9SS type A sorting domain-containing protein [Bacteroidota bacterium]
MKRSVTALLIFGFVISAGAQSFQISLEPFTVAGLPGLHSYAMAKYDGKWIIMNGRVEGLHQAINGFTPVNANKNIYLVNPQTKTSIHVSVDSLDASVAEQMKTSNTEFFQDGNLLLIGGGYGQNDAQAKKISYPFLTVVQLDSLVFAMENSLPVKSYFHQITDSLFAVTGGRMSKLNNEYLLVCGHNFIGATHLLPNAYQQHYTYSVRKFQLTNNAGIFSITHTGEYYDSLEMRRRDFNLAPQIFPDGSEGLTLFSGVFPDDINTLPYLNSVNISSTGISVIDTFHQVLNNYACPTLPLYDSAANEMHTLFFGGVGLYTVDMNGTFQQDLNFPFVKTIARVTRNSTGKMKEYKMGEMSSLLGTGGEFVLSESVPSINREIIKLNDWTTDTIFAGYLVGGVQADDGIVFVTNPDSFSRAYDTIYKVFLVKASWPNAVYEVSNKAEVMVENIFPQPATKTLNVVLNQQKTENVSMKLLTVAGQLISKKEFGKISSGKHTFIFPLESPAGIYLLQVVSGTTIVNAKVVVE